MPISKIGNQPKTTSRLPPLMISIVSPIVSESTAANRVDNDEEDEEYYVDNRYLLPRTPEVVYKSCLACLATEA